MKKTSKNKTPQTKHLKKKINKKHINKETPETQTHTLRHICTSHKHTHTHTHLCGSTKGMTKVNANHLASLQVDHEIGQMAITDAQQIMTDADHSVRCQHGTAQHVERFH